MLKKCSCGIIVDASARAAQVDDSEQAKPRRRRARRLHQVAVHDDPVVGREPAWPLETVRHPGLGRTAGRLAARVVAAAARHSQVALRRAEGKHSCERA